LDPLTFKAEGTKFLKKEGKIKHQQKAADPRRPKSSKEKSPLPENSNTR
jgi:hypothetical protein